MTGNKNLTEPLSTNMLNRVHSFFFTLLKRKHRYKYALVSLILLFSLEAKSQETINLPAYTHQYLHFGFIIGIDWANFVIDPKPNFPKFDTLRTIRSAPQTGFALGIVSEIKLTKYLKIRFVPALAFSDRELEYYFQGVDTFTVTKQTQSVFLNFPVDIKLISKRLKNFEAYVIGGGEFARDLFSQKNVNQQLAGVNATVRLLPNDWYYEAGGGLEFYLPYFKFGIELKISQGIKNLLVPDNTIYTESIETLKSKIYLLSFTFEG